MLTKDPLAGPTMHRGRLAANPLTFGELLQQLRRRAAMTQAELAVAVGYSVSYISNLEKNQRLPDVATVLEKFVPALGLSEEEQTALHLLELAAAVRGEALPASIHQRFSTRSAASVHEDAAQNKLPLPLLPILGREQELHTICNRCLAHAGRLFTLVGPPGIGKTTLALAVGARLQASFVDGVYFVPLAAVTDPERVGSAMMAALGLTQDSQNSKPPKVRLIEYLRRKQLLLVLDNFEQITAAATLLQDLLHECSRLCLLLTSRSALQLRIEQRFKVPALGLADAVALFVQRTQMIEPDFVLTAANHSVIEQICLQLDCLALAIELIAARVDLFTPQMLLNRLQTQALDLLHDDAPDRDPRHRTLRQAIHYSYTLLDPEEQALFRSLGVFVGSFDLAAVEGIYQRGDALQVAHSPIEDKTSDATALFSLLLRKSLVQVETLVDGERRFKLLETLRVYALEQLTKQNELAPTRHRHATYFCKLAEIAEAELYGPQELLWLNRLTIDYDNFRSALTWSLHDAHEQEIGLQLVCGLWWFWYVRSYHREAKAWIDIALSATTDKMPALRAKILQGTALLAWAAQTRENRPMIQTMIDESIALYRQSADKRNLARSLTYQGLLRKSYADYVPFAEEAKQLCREVNDLWGLAWVPLWEYYVMQPEGKHLPIQASVAVLRQIGGKSSLAFALLVLARQTYANGNFMLARRSIEESIALHHQVGHKWLTAHCLCFLGDLLRCQREFADIDAIYEEAIALAKQTGDSLWTPIIHYRQGLLAYVQDNYSTAAARFKESLRYAEQQTTDVAVRSINVQGIALVLSAQEKFPVAACLLAASHRPHGIFEMPDWPNEIGLSQACLATVRQHLHEAAFAEAWERGQTMSINEAVAYALQIIG